MIVTAIVSGLIAFIVVPTYRVTQLRSNLSKGFEHVRSLENAARVGTDKSAANGLGVITTTWANVFQDYGVTDAAKLESFVQAILKHDIQGPSPSFETLDSWLDSIATIDPKSKTYIKTLAKPNLRLSYKLPIDE